MRLKNFASALLAAAACVSTLPALGCYATTDAYIADESPPPPQDEYVVYRPGFVFIHGHWRHDGGRWAWHRGYYERERPGYVYVEGRWERHGNHHVWVNGSWRSRGGVVVRRY